jgi:hypothetical protein
MMLRPVLFAAGAGAAAAITLCPLSASAQMPPLIQVKVERMKPKEEKLPTLRFFKENLDFLRARLDGLQETPVTSGQEARALDERLLEYQELLLASRAARDSIDTARARREKEAFLSSVTALGELEAHLDFLEDVLARQEARLGVLEEDFLGGQHTAMIVVIKGVSPDRPPRGLRILDGFEEATEVAFRPEQLASLAQGGLIQVYHALIEPREQTWEVSLDGRDGDGDTTAYLTFSPRRNRLNTMVVDLTGADPGSPTTGLAVDAWFHDPSPLLSEGAR